jgi:hypothetical protein
MALLLKLTPQQSQAPFLGSAEQIGYTITQTDNQLSYDKANAGDYGDLIALFQAIKPENYVLDYEVI